MCSFSHVNMSASYNQKKEKSAFYELVRKIKKYRKILPHLKVSTLIEAPMVTEVPFLMPTTGNMNCLNSKYCILPRTENNHVVWRKSCCSGLTVDILNLVAKDIGMTYSLHGVADGQYGGFENGSWTGIVNDVFQGNSELGIQGLTPTEKRMEVVDFTEYFMLSALGIVRRKEKQEYGVVNWKFISILKGDLLLAILLSSVIIFIVILVLENMIYFISKHDYYPSREAFSYISGLVFQRDLAGKTPSKWSARVIAIVYAIGMTIVMTTYTANLTASNISYDTGSEFAGIRDNRVRIIYINY